MLTEDLRGSNILLRIETRLLRLWQKRNVHKYIDTFNIMKCLYVFILNLGDPNCLDQYVRTESAGFETLALKVYLLLLISLNAVGALSSHVKIACYWKSPEIV